MNTVDKLPENLMSSDALKLAVEHKVVELVNKAESVFGRALPKYSLSFNLRGRAAGQFRYERRLLKMSNCQLRFNMDLLERYQLDFIEEVVPHELAHFVAYSFYGARIKPHGVEWRSVMSEVYGRPPDVTHRYEVESKPRKTYPYVCQCEGREHQLGKTRHRRASEESVKYLCKTCKAPLRFKVGAEE